MSNVLNLISKIGKKEISLTERVFVSPVFSNTLVVTRVEGLLYSFAIPSSSENGWFQIKPIDTKKAQVLGLASLIEREMYLKHLDKIRIVIVMKKDGIFYGVPDKANKFGLHINDLLPVFLNDDTPMDFDRVITRFDGANIWFDQVDQSNDPTKADYLRTCMTKTIEPEKVKFSGLTPEERLAYTLRFSLDKRLIVDRKKESLKEDVMHAGGSFVSFLEKSDHYSVTYIVDGHQYTSNVAKDEKHSVLTAGICLSGEDKKFDLKSLITVMREGQNKRAIHRTNIEPDDNDDDWED